MTWYAVRTAPGAQLPQREYAIENTAAKHGKGYRIVPSLNPNISAVERALRDNGFKFYMPVERRLVRDRRKHDLWKPRRFAILLGYVFVTDVVDWQLLEETPGVAGIVGTRGTPMPINPKDMERLVQIEKECEEAYQRYVARMELNEAKKLAAQQKLSRAKVKQLYPSGSWVSATKGAFAGRTFVVAGLDRNGRLKMIADGLNAIGTISLPVSDVLLVA